jgi:hypothetical protein
MIFEDNAKKVFKLLLEFMSIKDEMDCSTIDIDDLNENFQLRGYNAPLGYFGHSIGLHEIVRKFLLIPNFTEEKLFDAISDDYNRGIKNYKHLWELNYRPERLAVNSGISDFKYYLKILEYEKEFNAYRGLRLVYQEKLDKENEKF